MKFRFYRIVGLSSLALLHTSIAMSGGFEKSIAWSGRYGGVAGAASAKVEGPESLYFNPAGLSRTEGFEVAANFSPTLSQTSGPIVRSYSEITSERVFSPPASQMVSYALNPKLAIGAAYYVAGGAKTTYSNVDFSSIAPNFANQSMTYGTNVSLMEASLGAGYEVLEGLRVGGAYRILTADASLNLPVVIPGPGLMSVSLNDLSGTEYNGMRLGVQYTPPKSRWGVGANWRNSVTFTATGNSSGTFIPAGGTTSLPLKGTTVTAKNTFPQQISVGGYYDLKPQAWRLLGEYTFTEYEKDGILSISGYVTLPSGAAVPLASIPQNWNNMHNVRFATEYSGLPGWVFRGGYVLTSQVVPDKNASAGFSSPGAAHTFVLGTGHRIVGTLAGDLAFEYSTASGNVAPSATALAGTYSTSVFAAHMGLSLKL